MADPKTWVEAPPRQKRPNTSLDVIPVIDVSSAHFVGYQFIPDPCAFPNPLPQECFVQYGPAAGTNKTFGDPGDELTTQVFGAYQGIECTLDGGVDEFRRVAERVLEAGQYRVVDGALAALLLSLATTSTGTSTSMAKALGLLEQVLSDQVPAQGYIYMSPAAATYAVANYLLIRNLDGSLETYLGTPIVILSEPSVALTMFASGPVTLWRAPVVVNDAVAVTTNLGRALAERLYSLAVECGAWKVTFTAPAETGTPPVEDPDEPLAMTLGSIPASPIPDGTDATIIVQTNVVPTAEVFLHYSINGDPEVIAGEMTQANPHEFIWNVEGSATTAGDSVEVWAVSEYDGADVESNHITIQVT